MENSVIFTKFGPFESLLFYTGELCIFSIIGRIFCFDLPKGKTIFLSRTQQFPLCWGGCHFNMQITLTYVRLYLVGGIQITLKYSIWKYGICIFSRFITNLLKAVRPEVIINTKYKRNSLDSTQCLVNEKDVLNLIA